SKAAYKLNKRGPLFRQVVDREPDDKNSKPGFAGLGSLAALAIAAISVSTFVASHSPALTSLSKMQQTPKFAASAALAGIRDSKTSGFARNFLVAQVLGTSTQASEASSPNLTAQITSVLNEFLAEGKFKGEKGDTGPQGPAGTSNTGIVQNGNGWSSAVVGGVPIVSYQPQNLPSYGGGSF